MADPTGDFVIQVAPGQYFWTDGQNTATVQTTAEATHYTTTTGAAADIDGYALAQGGESAIVRELRLVPQAAPVTVAQPAVAVTEPRSLEATGQVRLAITPDITLLVRDVILFDIDGNRRNPNAAIAHPMPRYNADRIEARQQDFGSDSGFCLALVTLKRNFTDGEPVYGLVDPRSLKAFRRWMPRHDLYHRYGVLIDEDTGRTRNLDPNRRSPRADS